MGAVLGMELSVSPSVVLTPDDLKGVKTTGMG